MRNKTFNQALSLFMAMIVFVTSVGITPLVETYAAGGTTKPGKTTNHWFSTPVRVGQDVAVIDGYDVVTNNLPEGVFAYAIPGKNGGAPYVDSTQLYEPISTAEYIADMAEKNIFRYSAEDMNAMMANVLFNTPDIRDIDSIVSELRSYGLGGDVGKYTIATAEEYLDMLISKNTFSTSSQLQKNILAALKGMEVPAPSIGIEYDKAGISSPAFHEDGFYYFGPITVAASGYKPNNDLGFKLTKFDVNGADTGAELVRHGTADEPIEVNSTKIEHGEELYIKMKDSSYVSSVNLEFTFTHYERDVQIYRSQNANGMYLASPYFKETNVVASEGFGEFGAKGMLIIRRFDMNGNPLNGGSYSIKALDAGNSFADVTGLIITENGEIRIENLPMGSYEVWEDGAPPGHTQVKAHQFFEIYEDGQIVIKEFYSDKFLVRVKVNLVDADTGLPITHGGSASIINIDTGETVATGLFSPTGYWECELPFGNYAVQAGESPDRYFFIEFSNPVQFQIKDENDAPEITLEARLVKGSVTLHVKEWMNTPAVPGALFYLYNAETGERITKYDKLITNSSGIIEIPAIEYGKYYLVQQPFPEYSKYIPDTTPLYFNIYGKGYLNDQGQYVTQGTNWVYTHENKLKRGAVEVSVIDEEGNVVDGLEFSIFRKSDPNNVLFSQFTSGGQVTFYDLDPDTYLIKWTNKLEEYIYDSTVLEATIKEDGDFIQLTFPVLRFKRGTVIANKVDSITNNPIRDVYFVVVDEFGNEVARIRTGDDGSATASGLKVGTYYIQEVKENEKYNPNKSYTPFIITEHGQVVRLTFKETIKQGTLTVRAVDEDGNPIVGVQFSVYNMSNVLVAQGTTDIDGYWYVSGLTYGEYNIFNDETPVRYQKITVPTKFAIENMYDEVHKEFVFKEVTGTITIIKRDKITKEPLPFAEFYLYEYDTGKHVGTAVSDGNGKATFKNVPYGRYYVIEVKAPPGYQLNTDIIGGGHDLTAPSDGWPIGHGGVAKGNGLFGLETVYATSKGGGLWIDENNQNIVVDGGVVTTPPDVGDSDGDDSTDEGGSLAVTFKPYAQNSSARSMLLALIDNSTSTIKEFLVVDSTQSVTFKELDVGKYTLQVVNYPATWQDRIDAKEFVITESNQNIVAFYSSSGWTYENKLPDGSIEGDSDISWGERIYGSVDIYVKSDSALPLADVKLGIFDMNGTSVGTYFTDSSGRVFVSQLEYGKYYIRQLNVLDNYLPDSEVHLVNIEQHGKCIEVYLTNIRESSVPETPEVELPEEPSEFSISGGMAVDRGDGTLDSSDYGMSGYRVTLFNSNGSYVDSTYTDQYGRYSFKVTSAGVYNVRFDLPLGYNFLQGNGTNLANERGYAVVVLGEEETGYANCLLIETSEPQIPEEPDNPSEPPIPEEPDNPSEPPIQDEDFEWVDVPITEELVVQTRALGKTGNEARQYYYVGDGTNGNPLGLPDTGDRANGLVRWWHCVLAFTVLVGSYVYLERKRKNAE